ncbi:hypothetical protein KC19_12G117200 [Ceratodon purpureus]|uniref:Uncharacterized protein n=1 Tax=Ceratodon purpureus TaxID=3225 RepID=A0A8T0G6W4_CERPU|nr:hypothetical protein KC19_12G117200 [Ceratodon purpureus]
MQHFSKSQKSKQSPLRPCLPLWVASLPPKPNLQNFKANFFLPSSLHRMTWEFEQNIRILNIAKSFKTDLYRNA